MEPYGFIYLLDHHSFILQKSVIELFYENTLVFNFKHFSTGKSSGHKSIIPQFDGGKVLFTNVPIISMKPSATKQVLSTF